MEEQQVVADFVDYPFEIGQSQKSSGLVVGDDVAKGTPEIAAVGDVDVEKQWIGTGDPAVDQPSKK